MSTSLQEESHTGVELGFLLDGLFQAVGFGFSGRDRKLITDKAGHVATHLDFRSVEYLKGLNLFDQGRIVWRKA